MDLALQEMVEARAIEQLMIRYIDRVDANDPVGAAACFAEDGLGVYWGDYRGREAIAERLGGILAGFTATSHHLSNVAPVITGDSATSQAYVYAFHRRAGSGDHLHVRLRIEDHAQSFTHGLVIVGEENAKFSRHVFTGPPFRLVEPYHVRHGPAEENAKPRIMLWRRPLWLS